MAKKIKGNIPDFQERVLMAMYASLLDPAGAHGDWLYFQKGRGIAHALGGVWSTYRHNQMLKLQESGAVICYKKLEDKATWYYALTEKGIARTREILVVARQEGYFIRLEHYRASLSQESLFPSEATIDEIPF